MRGGFVILLSLGLFAVPSLGYKIEKDFWRSVDLPVSPFDFPNNYSTNSVSTDAGTKQGGRLAYGTAASAGQFGFVGLLAIIQDFSSFTSNCGGTVIAPTYVLTAARCLFKDKSFAPPTHVLLGGIDASSLNNFPEKLSVSKVFYPNQYKPDVANSNYDVAVLKLSKATTVGPITLAATVPSPGSTLMTVGWGTNQLSAGITVLRYGTFQVGTFGTSPCAANCFNQSPCTTICSVGAQQGIGYTTLCQGDAGGPGMQLGAQVAVTSFGSSDCSTDSGGYGYSTPISAVNPFIQDILANGGGSTPPAPTQTPTPIPSSTPGPTTSPSTTPPASPPSESCKLSTSSGVVVGVSLVASSCNTRLTDATAKTVGDVSGSKEYCASAKCSKVGSAVVIKVKLAVSISRNTARLNVLKSFKNGSYYRKFKENLPNEYTRYQLKSGTACTFPSPSCTY